MHQIGILLDEFDDLVNRLRSFAGQLQLKFLLLWRSHSLHLSLVLSVLFSYLGGVFGVLHAEQVLVRIANDVVRQVERMDGLVLNDDINELVKLLLLHAIPADVEVSQIFGPCDHIS